jgi:hypothetical protein
VLPVWSLTWFGGRDVELVPAVHGEAAVGEAEEAAVLSPEVVAIVVVLAHLVRHLVLHRPSKPNPQRFEGCHAARNFIKSINQISDPISKWIMFLCYTFDCIDQNRIVEILHM